MEKPEKGLRSPSVSQLKIGSIVERVKVIGHVKKAQIHKALGERGIGNPERHRIDERMSEISAILADDRADRMENLAERKSENQEWLKSKEERKKRSSSREKL